MVLQQFSSKATRLVCRFKGCMFKSQPAHKDYEEIYLSTRQWKDTTEEKDWPLVTPNCLDVPRIKVYNSRRLSLHAAWIQICWLVSKIKCSIYYHHYIIKNHWNPEILCFCRMVTATARERITLPHSSVTLQSDRKASAPHLSTTIPTLRTRSVSTADTLWCQNTRQCDHQNSLPSSDCWCDISRAKFGYDLQMKSKCCQIPASLWFNWKVVSLKISGNW